jgi:hypothetical protein
MNAACFPELIGFSPLLLSRESVYKLSRAHSLLSQALPFRAYFSFQLIWKIALLKRTPPV